MNLKQLVEKEHTEKTERMKKETVGGYILFYLAAGFNIFASMLYGFHMDSTMGIVVLECSFGAICIYMSFNKYLYSIKENGKINNIFLNYKNTPVDFKTLYLAKAIVAGKSILGQALLAQLAALLIRAADPDHDGGSVTDFTVWIPLITGIGALLLFLLLMGLKCKKAKQ